MWNFLPYESINSFGFTPEKSVILRVNKQTTYKDRLFYQLQAPWALKSNCFLEKDILLQFNDLPWGRKKKHWNILLWFSFPYKVLERLTWNKLTCTCFLETKLQIKDPFITSRYFIPLSLLSANFIFNLVILIFMIQFILFLSEYS